MAEHGVPIDDILEGTGVSWEEIKRNDVINIWIYSEVFHRIATCTSLDFAKNCGECIQEQFLGAVGFAVARSEDIGEAIRVMCKYYGLSDYPFRGELIVDENYWKYQFYPRVPMSPETMLFMVQFGISGFRSFALQLCHDAPEISMISLPAPISTETCELETYDTRSIKYDRPHFMLTGKTQDLSIKIRSADASALAICLAQCEAAQRQRQRQLRASDQVLEMLASTAGPLNCLATMADRLAMSKRTLQRKLSLEATSFKALVQDYRINQSRLLSASEAFNNKQIAYRLGYRNVSSVYRLKKSEVV